MQLSVWVAVTAPTFPRCIQRSRHVPLKLRISGIGAGAALALAIRLFLKDFPTLDNDCVASLEPRNYLRLNGSQIRPNAPTATT